MKKLVLIILSLLVISACSKPEADTITILTSSGYHPFEMVDEAGELIGFDIEFGVAIAKELGKDVEWVDMDFGGIIAALNANQGDMAIAAISPDPKRDVLFSKSYYTGAEESPFFVLTTKTSGITSSADIANRTVGVQIGTVQEQMINQLKDQFNLNVDQRPSVTQMAMDVDSGRLDLMVVEGPTAKEYVKEFESFYAFELTNETIQAYLIEVDGISIALPKDSQLLDQVNAAIDALETNGTLQQLIDKWFH
jgi:polar amino acid transport system substrate-binding protein